eukprot:TRINITY_DN2725_c0_g1_i3.p1 TRINITY_DN2725_c0_g1~~TRINITY_DN2725_c0_g1_i3.p1  ORF type:complete len:460 (+),score=81.25 TRINITY_DN2725_c0_g1_i3:83-1462(+)
MAQYQQWLNSLRRTNLKKVYIVDHLANTSIYEQVRCQSVPSHVEYVFVHSGVLNSSLAPQERIQIVNISENIESFASSVIPFVMGQIDQYLPPDTSIHVLSSKTGLMSLEKIPSAMISSRSIRVYSSYTDEFEAMIKREDIPALSVDLNTSAVFEELTRSILETWRNQKTFDPQKIRQINALISLFPESKSCLVDPLPQILLFAEMMNPMQPGADASTFFGSPPIPSASAAGPRSDTTWTGMQQPIKAESTSYTISHVLERDTNDFGFIPLSTPPPQPSITAMRGQSYDSIVYPTPSYPSLRTPIQAQGMFVPTSNFQSQLASIPSERTTSMPSHQQSPVPSRPSGVMSGYQEYQRTPQTPQTAFSKKYGEISPHTGLPILNILLQTIYPGVRHWKDEYMTLQRTGPDHVPNFEIRLHIPIISCISNLVFLGNGRTRKDSEKEACYLACLELFNRGALE